MRWSQIKRGSEHPQLLEIILDLRLSFVVLNEMGTK